VFPEKIPQEEIECSHPREESQVGSSPIGLNKFEGLPNENNIQSLTADKLDWDSTCFGCNDNLVYARLLSKLFGKKYMARGSKGEKGVDVRELGNRSEYIRRA
jgi:hypothetical protein